jgi:GNAT superfamily N-acetyltransferase
MPKMSDEARRGPRDHTPPVHVRPATRHDVPQLVALMTEFYAEAGFALLAGPAARAFERLVADPSLGGVWLLAADGVPAGYVAVTLAFSLEHGGLRGFVDDLFVRAPARGRGLAAAGLTAVRDACEALGVRALYVETGEESAAARRLYERQGFTDTRRLLLALPLASPVHAT